MKRPTRRPSFALVVSLVILLCAAICWPRGRTRGDGIVILGRNWIAAIGTGGGGASIVGGKIDIDTQYVNTVQPFSAETIDYRRMRELWHGSNDGMLNRIGIRLERADWTHDSGTSVFIITLPWWLITLLATVAPIRSFQRRRMRRLRALSWRCVECGYDLRASPNRCPECGATPRFAPEAPAPYKLPGAP